MNSIPKIRWWGVWIILLTGYGDARAGLVYTTSGKMIEGHLEFAPPDTLIVKREGKSPLTLLFTEVARATFAATDEALANGGFNAEGWTAEDVGNVGLAGSTGLVDGTWYLRGGGGYIGEKEDGCHLVSTKVSGDCELAVRVTKVTCNDKQGRAGIMLREVLQGRSKFVALLVKADGTYSFRTRTEWGKNADVRFTQPAPTPCWIKLKKDKERITAYKSADGQKWESVGRVPVAMNRDYYAGLAIANRNPKAPCTAVLDRMVLTVSGVWGEYFAEATWTDLRFKRRDSQISFGWGLDAPDERLSQDNFSVRWTGKLAPKYSENYLFYYDADDTAKLWIDHQEIPRRSLKKDAGRQDGGLPLQAGRRYDLKMDYREGGGSASVRLGWSSQSQGLEIIPASAFYCRIVPEPAATSQSATVPYRQLMLTKGILLRTGTFLSGSITSLDDQLVKLRRSDGKQLSVFWHQVALVSFRPPRIALTIEDACARSGVLLQNGDWFEGDVRGIKRRKLLVSSVLYGLREFNQHQGDVAAWRLAEPNTAAAPFEVRLTDGSVFMGQTLAVEAGALRLEELALGEVQIPQNLVQEISCRNSR